MISQLFRKRECSAYQSTTALAQRIIEPLDMIGLTTLLPDRPMPFGWQDGRIRLPKIRVADRTLAIDHRKRGPEFARCGFGSRPNRHAHDFACVAIERKPDPFLAAFLADKRPEFITFQNQAPLFCSVTVTERGTAAYLAFT